jgi:hypothetical protein
MLRQCLIVQGQHVMTSIVEGTDITKLIAIQTRALSAGLLLQAIPVKTACSLHKTLLAIVAVRNNIPALPLPAMTVHVPSVLQGTVVTILKSLAQG